MEYLLLTGEGSTLEKKVQRKLDEGWELHGQPFATGRYSYPDAYPILAQAVIRRKRPKPPKEEEETE